MSLTIDQAKQLHLVATLRALRSILVRRVSIDGARGVVERADEEMQRRLALCTGVPYETLLEASKRWPK